LIFGQALFADIPFSELGKPPFVDTGWQDLPKDPCEEEAWVKVGSNCVDPIKIEKPTSEWMVIK
jgi:hypothetical protein